MKCLVTGGAGFIGSHVVDLLIQEGHDVSVVDNLSTGSENNLNSSSRLFETDIRDVKRLESIFYSERPDVVFHLAAQVDVGKSMRIPIEDAEINILGSLNVLEACRKSGVKKVIYSNSGGAGSGEPQYFPVDEDHPISPMSHYGVSKHTVEHYLEVYRDLHGLKFTSLRYANIYGPRQDPFGEGGVVAIFSRKLLDEESPVIFGDGNQTRDFMYVGDVAKVNLLCMEGADNLILNVGTGSEISVNDLFFKLRGIEDSEIPVIYGSAREGDIYRSVLGISLLQKEFPGFQFEDLSQGLMKTMEWFKDN